MLNKKEVLDSKILEEIEDEDEIFLTACDWMKSIKKAIRDRIVMYEYKKLRIGLCDRIVNEDQKEFEDIDILKALFDGKLKVIVPKDLYEYIMEEF